jgi:hypothetical protein
MCYTTTTHFSRCSHRTSTTTLCPRSTHHEPTVSHPTPSYTRPCVTNGRERGVFACRDELCDACRRVNFWFADGGGGARSNNRTRRDESGARRKKNKGSAVRTTGGSPNHCHSSATQRRSVPRPGPAESTYPVPTAAQGTGRCPLSEAFARAMRIEVGDGDVLTEGSQRVSGEEGDGEGMDRSMTREQKGEYGPFMPPHFSPDAGSRSGGLPRGGLSSWSNGCGEYPRRTMGRRTAGNKKRVRFAPKVEVLYFRRDWDTRTLRSLRGECRGRR